MNVKIKDTFWNERMDIVRKKVIPYQWEALNDRLPDVEPSHAIKNLRIAAGDESGEFKGMVFQDSDVMKWLEAVAYILEHHPDEELEETADTVIDLLQRAQQDDGYLDTYFIVKEPEMKWKNLRDWHELYCAGHLIEAAVAYFHATGKRKLLDISCRFADKIDDVFGTEANQIQGYPGHQEIELALLRLYETTGEERYLNLSRFFLDERGKEPHYFDKEKEERGEPGPADWDGYFKRYSYQQAHLPVRNQTEAVGHSVRAMYMYTAMADMAAKTEEKELVQACHNLWKNVTTKQMYITGGLGSQEFGESFSFDYDLPNDLCYTETCASIGLVFWANRMLKMDINHKYGDVMERALYNGILSGMDLDGRKFFYVNPLEVWPESVQARKDKEHVKPVRQPWYACACCPPNLARIIASLNHYIYNVSENEVFVHLYIGSEIDFEVAGQNVTLSQQTDYPWDENVNFEVSLKEKERFTLALRIPAWTSDAALKVNGESVSIEKSIEDGYVYVNRTWFDGDKVELYLPLEIQKMRSHPNLRHNASKVALQRGPIVYCLEEIDNGPALQNISLKHNTQLRVEHGNDIANDVLVIKAEAEKTDSSDWGDELYSAATREKQPITMMAVPYYTWCNRDPGEMLVWINEK
ncbi:DUF1680 family protein [Salibacterium salarium]|uniref:glycoside hydrolase family 127 protein n=1 Tax=Salibacterium salarium TaxID=284579 RepID=UPI002781C1CC|nr:beta-L-arabinofuranosidase domain-containing protein [Salibacterium salarium]MDQ0299291.1 DUF1680 family protein [Salibacterium salarium]